MIPIGTFLTEPPSCARQVQKDLFRRRLHAAEGGERPFRRRPVKCSRPGGNEPVEELDDVEELLPPLAVHGSFPREQEFSGLAVVSARNAPLRADDLARKLGVENDAQRSEEVVIRPVEGIAVGEPDENHRYLSEAGVADAELGEAGRSGKLPAQADGVEGQVLETQTVYCRCRHAILASCPIPTAGLQDPTSHGVGEGRSGCLGGGDGLKVGLRLPGLRHGGVDPCEEILETVREPADGVDLPRCLARPGQEEGLDRIALAHVLKCERCLERGKIAPDAVVERSGTFDAERERDHARLAGGAGDQARRIPEVMSVVGEEASRIRRRTRSLEVQRPACRSRA
jgi:hypothetical protein